VSELSAVPENVVRVSDRATPRRKLLISSSSILLRDLAASGNANLQKAPAVARTIGCRPLGRFYLVDLEDHYYRQALKTDVE
jgi:hypothetical protein